ncbi:MAG: CRISPR-associated endonuclease Cas2 [Desulfurococcales archaeon]|nr:CRISPR-associated endonuclease Cas2 [Desulfurococcales archaeon]
MARVIVVYDISDDRARLRAARTLQAWGLERIQRSAFAGRAQRARAVDLARRLERIVDPDTDTVHVLVVDERTWGRVVVIGKPYWARVGGDGLGGSASIL